MNQPDTELRYQQKRPIVRAEVPAIGPPYQSCHPQQRGDQEKGKTAVGRPARPHHPNHPPRQHRHAIRRPAAAVCMNRHHSGSQPGDDHEYPQNGQDGANAMAVEEDDNGAGRGGKQQCRCHQQPGGKAEIGDTQPVALAPDHPVSLRQHGSTPSPAPNPVQPGMKPSYESEASTARRGKSPAQEKIPGHEEENTCGTAHHQKPPTIA